MNKRPKITIPKSTMEKVHDWVCFIVIIGMSGYLIVSISQMPETIPTHYNAKGEADHWGSKWSILIPLAIMIGMYFFLSLLQKHPEVHNFPGPRTEKNDRNAKMMASWIKLEVVLVFAYMIWNSIQDSLGGSTGLGTWFLPAIAITFILTIMISIIRFIRGNNRNPNKN